MKKFVNSSINLANLSASLALNLANSKYNANSVKNSAGGEFKGSENLKNFINLFANFAINLANLNLKENSKFSANLAANSIINLKF